MIELWTPWRMRYITSAPRDDGCVFCRLQEGGDEDGLILYRGPLCFVVMNLFPYTVGHTMVIPYRHLARMSELSSAELVELGASAARTERILRRHLRADQVRHGINLGRPAGAGVDGHLHLHLVPFGSGIPTLARGTELPVPLEITSERLRKGWSQDVQDSTTR